MNCSKLVLATWHNLAGLANMPHDDDDEEEVEDGSSDNGNDSSPLNELAMFSKFSFISFKSRSVSINNI